MIECIIGYVWAKPMTLPSIKSTHCWASQLPWLSLVGLTVQQDKGIFLRSISVPDVRFRTQTPLQVLDLAFILLYPTIPTPLAGIFVSLFGLVLGLCMDYIYTTGWIFGLLVLYLVCLFGLFPNSLSLSFVIPAFHITAIFPYWFQPVCSWTSHTYPCCMLSYSASINRPTSVVVGPCAPSCCSELIDWEEESTGSGNSYGWPCKRTPWHANTSQRRPMLSIGQLSRNTSNSGRYIPFMYFTFRWIIDW